MALPAFERSPADLGEVPAEAWYSSAFLGLRATRAPTTPVPRKPLPFSSTVPCLRAVHDHDIEGFVVLPRRAQACWPLSPSFQVEPT